MISRDRHSLRSPLQLGPAPRVPIVWLLLPWLAGLWWSARIAEVLLAAPSAEHVAWALVRTAVIGRFLLTGGLGTVATWVWLYFAWPDHPRVLCWAAAAAFAGLWIGPGTANAVVPLFVSLCMCSAIVEQAWSVRRAQGGRSRAAPAV